MDTSDAASTSQLTWVKEENQSLLQEFESLQKIIIHLNDGYDRLVSVATELYANVIEAKGDLAATIEHIESFSIMLHSKMNMEMERLTNTLTENEVEKGGLKNKLATEKSEIEGLTERYIKLEIEVECLIQILKEQEERHRKIVRKKSKKLRQKEQTKEDLMKENQMSMEKHRQDEEKLQKLNKRYEKLQAEQKALKQNNEASVQLTESSYNNEEENTEISQSSQTKSLCSML